MPSTFGIVTSSTAPALPTATVTGWNWPVRRGVLPSLFRPTFTSRSRL
jgi:hypothetical protein